MGDEQQKHRPIVLLLNIGTVKQEIWNIVQVASKHLNLSVYCPGIGIACATWPPPGIALAPIFNRPIPAWAVSIAC